MRVRAGVVAAVVGTAFGLAAWPATTAHAGACPAVTVDDNMGVGAGAYPQQYDLAEFESAANCTLTFSENPRIGELNGKIVGNPALPPLLLQIHYCVLST